MRYDMDRVVIERPREGGAVNYHDIRVRFKGMDIEDLDDLPKKEGYRHAHALRGDPKSLSDLLGPLHRFLISRVGQKWNDVYSEIRERLNPNSTTQIHILGHVMHMVEVDTFIEDGRVCVLGRWAWPHEITNGELYVHPETGILERMPEQKHPWKSAERKEAEKKLRDIFGPNWYTRDVIEEAENHLLVGKEKELHKMDGVWYWAVFSDVPPPFSEKWFDARSGETRTRTIQRGACDYWTGVAHTEGRYRSGRQQANRRDLRRHGLSND